VGSAAEYQYRQQRNKAFRKQDSSHMASGCGCLRKENRVGADSAIHDVTESVLAHPVENH
jgi:hypothetical protein